MSTPLRPPDESPIKPRVPPPIDIPPARPRVVSTPGREQEQSIRERKQLLFEEDERPAGPPVEAAPTKPFVEYLRTTPAAPLSGLAKVLIWTAGVLVVLLFVASLIKGANRPAKPPAPRGAASARM
jgi:hypothetical protein